MSNRAAQPKPRANSPCLLVVEDDAALRSLLRLGLERRGFTVVLAASGREAIEAYPRHSPDLVLLDVCMPEMDGIETLVELQRLDPAVRACFMSGHTGHYDADALSAAGCLRFFRKPFSLIALADEMWRLAHEPASHPA